MIAITDISNASVNSVQFIVRGDDLSTSLKIDLTKPPFSFNFGTLVPSSVEVITGDDITAIGSILLGVLTLTFNQAPRIATTLGVTVKFLYHSI